jgi:two-component system, NtrC family, response regulator AtoC
MSTKDFTLDAMTMTAAARGVTSDPMEVLVVHHGQETDSSSAVRLAADTELTIGRSRKSTIVVDNPAVSQSHARIARVGNSVEISDLGSRNGTKVNGRKIEATTTLATGDEVTVGPLTAFVMMTVKAKRGSGVALPERFESRLRAELDRARRYQRSVGVAMLNIVATDEVLEVFAESLREMDLMADYGANQFAILFPEMGRPAVADALQRLAVSAMAGGMRLSAGVVAAPSDGLSVDELLGKSQTQLRIARDTGVTVSVSTDVTSATPAATTRAPTFTSTVMQRVYSMVDRVADAQITVLVLGETGVGKELVAEAIALRSASRKDKPLVKLNCASLPETLLESELFGHERGAFTGADKRKIGFFEAASGGTLFLDEIGEMPLGLQAKLLRVMERKVVTRVGGTEEIAVDTRVVAATHRDLEAEVKAGRFREDLFFRVSGFTIAIPPLRNRQDEILTLAEYFCKSMSTANQASATLAADAQAALLAYDWPGNVRELKNAIERALVLQSDGTITAMDLPDRVRETAQRQAWSQPSGDSIMRDQLGTVERAALVAALEASGQNQTKAAKRLGLSRRALIYKMEKYGLKAAPISRDGEGS